MSKRAEEAALKAYPDIPLPHLGKNVIAHCGDLRLAYQQGYEQAEKDFSHIIIRLAESILFDWDNKAEIAKEALKQIEDYE